MDGDADPVAVWFDPPKLRKVLDNLLSNALKFTPSGGKVRLAVGRDGDHAMVRVQDTGPGVPAADLPHLFDRFYQTGAGQLQGGSGLGLALVRELIARHGGSVHAESEAELGTTFFVRLPLGRDHLPDEDMAAESAAAESPIAPPERPAQGATVLLVEDDADLRAWIRQILAARYAVLEAEDGEEALDLATAHIPDLVLSDVLMPGLDGHGLCAALRADTRTRHLPVVLLTAQVSAESQVRGLEGGADAWLAKPFQPRALLAQIESLLAARERQQAHVRQAFLTTPEATEVTSADDAFLHRIRETVHDRMSDGDFGIAELARAVGMSRRQLHRKLRALTGETPSALLRQLRLGRARQLLEQRWGNVSEVAFAVGFHKPGHFAALYKEAWGISPSEVLAGRGGQGREAATLPSDSGD